MNKIFLINTSGVIVHDLSVYTDNTICFHIFL